MREEEECRLRTPFQRDRDRIVHCKAFRRLKHKTQVFIDPRGDHYRTRLTHTLETAGHLPHGRPGAAAERGPDRGDRARPRPRPRALRPHRRGGARRGALGALRPPLPPQRAVAPRRRASRARRARAQPHRRDPRRDPQPHGAERAGDPRGQDRPPGRPRRLHQPRHRRRASRRRAPRRTSCRSEELALLGERGSRRIDTLVHDIVESSAEAGDIVQSEEIGRAMLDLRAFMFERVYLGPAAEEQRDARRRDGSPHLRPARRAPGGAAARPPGRRAGAGHGLRRRDDRPLRARMAVITQTSIDQVKAAADMVEIVARPHAAAEGGARWTGRCPFHEERTPSFSVDPAEKLFYCHGCGKGGDLITFVRETEGLDFVGAIEWLADRYRIPLEYEETSPQVEAGRKRRDRLLALLEQAATFYGRHLWETPAGEPVRAYLGRARPRRGGLPRVPARPLAGRRRTGGEGAREGLHAGRAGGGGPRQPARERLLRGPARLPARRRARPGARLRRAPAARRRPDSGEVRELARGRALPQGLDRLRPRPRARRDREGGPGRRRRGLHRRARAPPGGHEAVVASMGTALTEPQLKELRRLTRHLYLCFDADAAGEAATLRGMELAVRAGLRRARRPAAAGPRPGRGGRRLRAASRRVSRLPARTASRSRSSGRRRGRKRSGACARCWPASRTRPSAPTRFATRPTGSTCRPTPRRGSLPRTFARTGLGLAEAARRRRPSGAAASRGLLDVAGPRRALSAAARRPPLRQPAAPSSPRAPRRRRPRRSRSRPRARGAWARRPRRSISTATWPASSSSAWRSASSGASWQTSPETTSRGRSSCRASSAKIRDALDKVESELR